MSLFESMNDSGQIVSDSRLVGLILRADAATDAPLTAFAYANIAVFTAVLFSLSGLNSHSVIAYVLAVFFSVLATTVIAKLSLKLGTTKMKSGLITMTIIVNELAMASILLFAFYGNSQADVFAAIAIVAGISFISVPLSARYVTPFWLSKVAVISACAAFAIITPAAEHRMVEIIASLTVTLLIMLFIGYWIIKKRALEIQLRLELSALNNSVEAQNQRLQTALTEIEAERAKAEDSFALRQRLLSYVGHDLRQPISAALLMILELSNKKQTASQKAILADTRECLQSAGRMIEDVVQITHYDNPAIEVFIAPLEIDGVLQQIVREYERDARNNSCKIRYVSTTAEVLSDGDLLLRIIRNLARNVVKHSGAKNMLIGVRRFEHDIEVWVVDDGNGMPNGSQIDDVQSNRNVQDHGRGLGLGLKISKQLATACGMELTVASRLGAGTCCKVRIPNS